jgi:hypothetical protein
MISAVNGLPMLHHPLIAGLPCAQSAFSVFAIMSMPPIDIAAIVAKILHGQ